MAKTHLWGSVTMTSELDKSKKFSLLVGITGVHFVQDGKYYGALGNEVLLNEEKTEAIGPAKETDIPDAPVAEPEYEGTVQSMADFEEFSAFLDTISAKRAKKLIKAFAANTLDIEMTGNRKLEVYVDEARAEFKALLEAGIE